MSRKLLDFKCTNCPNKEEKYVDNNDLEALKMLQCSVCGSGMERMLSAPSGRVHGIGQYTSMFYGKGK